MIAKKKAPSEKLMLRRNERIALKAAAVAELTPLLDKVPPLVCGGTVQITRRWIYDNRKANAAAKRGSLERVQAELGIMRQWAQNKQPDRDRAEQDKPL